MELTELLDRLFLFYGPQGWWPLPSRAGQGIRDDGGYLKGPSVIFGSNLEPEATQARFEIAIGAVLAQNTAWAGASRSLVALSRRELLDPSSLIGTSREKLHACIKTSGTYTRKAAYLQNLALQWVELDRGIPARSRLLGITGIGFETADCILLYAYGVPVFIADAYARRIMTRHGLLNEVEARNYESTRTKAEKQLPLNAGYLAEAHALLVEHAKCHCRATPSCKGCPVEHGCRKIKRC
ncbi:MAG: hypothetical protein A3J97_16660 [Spirochaetes bacterium RIFOXYC1_FULL_54_7]|nr:MAG: hypothetical protein A3J97_16660 [Spirochaetes bacterium RIFOXYC1_FULL_54_7]